MPGAMRIELLPARLGDCLLVECLREDGRPWRMLIDGGPPDTWPLLEARLRRMPADDQAIDVAVITHIDSDHIGGMIPLLSSDLTSRIGDVWFNGRTHLPSDQGGARSIDQGETVVSTLLGGARPGLAAGKMPGGPLPWNTAFGGGAIDTAAPAGVAHVSIPGGPTITVVSPTLTQLHKLGATWLQVVAQAQREERPLPQPDVLEPLTDLQALASRTTVKDTSVANGSSIAVLVEHRGASAVLAGDAFGPVLAAGLAGIAKARGLKRLEVDAFKLPHHGSQANVTAALLATAPAGNYLVSSNGDVFHHPDDIALARVITGAPTPPALWFNYRNARTARWADPALTGRYGHTANFPDPAQPDAGVVLELPVRTG
ncbi:MAG TPA: MBL fold metallo-hydrolase [Humibacillus xanthopallidus]|nr:MBL fold metallo-hydrolase [Humibacillus xanthopallidus]